jgi:cobalt/nickel transport system permease protein
VKIAAMVLFVVAVVATPREAFWAYGLYAALMMGVIVLAELPLRTVGKRMLIELPFVLFAFLLPFLGGGERIDVLGVAVSREGLWGAWTILSKASLGIAASIILSATTTVPDILSGLDRLRVPRVITAIAGFMIRYLDVVISELNRRRTAMAARGYEPRWIWQNRALASSAGALFIRSYERGERVYAAMVARGYEGHMPRLRGRAASGVSWAAGLAVPAVAWVIVALAWTVLR